MVFSSAIFLLVFLPVTLLLYFIIPNRVYRNVLLLIMSIVFYAWGEPVYIVLLICSVIINWGFGKGIANNESKAKTYLVWCIIINLLLLGFFKYEGFITDNINALLGTNIKNLELPLPVGISFYTLQALTYIIDVYRKKVPAQTNILYLGMYIAMFPQLVAGPIVRYSTIQDQILNRKESISGFCSGIRLFSIGLAKKVLLANVVAILADKMLAMGGAQIGAVGAWAGLIAFTFQIFFDFSGYSDMAIGLGKMFGFEYQRNFNYPYISKSITEFWRRWHISLGSFFRDYVYIPLGGNRVSKGRWVLNLFIVWFLTGFWHGANWNFILWGLFYGVILAIEKLWLLERLQKIPAFFQHLYTIVLFVLGWALFWVEDMGELGAYLSALFGGFGTSGSSTLWELTAWSYVPVFIVCILACLPVVPWIRGKLLAWARGEKAQPVTVAGLANPKALDVTDQCVPDNWLAELVCGQGIGLDDVTLAKRRRIVSLVFTLADLCCLLLLVLSVVNVISGTFNPFIYFRF